LSLNSTQARSSSSRLRSSRRGAARPIPASRRVGRRGRLPRVSEVVVLVVHARETDSKTTRSVLLVSRHPNLVATPQARAPQNTTMVREFKDKALMHPITAFIASFMEDPQERDDRYAAHMQRGLKVCADILKDYSTPDLTTESSNPAPRVCVRTIPGNELI